MESLKENGRLEMEYTPPDCFPGPPVKFANHEELDIYIMSLLGKIPDFQKTYKYDWALLKAYGMLSFTCPGTDRVTDRAFWLMFYNRSETNLAKRQAGIERGMPGEEVPCPFGNPRETGTILGGEDEIL